MPPGLVLEFPVADLGQRVEVKDLTEKLYEDIVNKVDESDVLGVQVVPQRWPRKVRVVCAHQAAKDCLLIQGLDLYGKHVDLNEPGNGIIKVTIQDAPIEMSNDIIKSWVEQYGIVSEFRNEHATYQNKRLNWKTGVRYAYVINLRESIPPSAKLPFDGGEITITVWHYGQTHMKCRWCKDIVPKGEHSCARAPVRKCFNCGSEDHIKAACNQGRCCYKCGSSEHIARDCQNQARDAEQAREHGDLAVAGESPVLDTVPVSHSTPGQQPTTDQHMPTETSELGSFDTMEGSVILDHTPERVQAKVLLMGGSNCRGLELQGEDWLDLAVTPLIQGGLLIEEAAEKLDECSKELKSETDIVVVHVGSCNFPANDFTDIDRHYTHYVELLNTITNNCPKANIVVSSVLPRNGHQNTNINDQIKTFNRKLAELAWTEEKIQFSDNFGHFEGENDEVDRNLFKTSDRSGVHLNVDGQGRLATALVHCVKEAFFKRKLEAELEIAPPPPY